MSRPMHRRAKLRPWWLAALNYLCYASAGLAFMVLPTTGLKELLGELGFVVWNLLLIVGGALAVFGAITKKHWPELIGMPGVVTSLGVYGIYIAAAVRESDNPGVVLGLALICFGAGIGGVGRAYEVWQMEKVNAAVARRLNRERGSDG